MFGCVHVAKPSVSPQVQLEGQQTVEKVPEQNCLPWSVQEDSLSGLHTARFGTSGWLRQLNASPSPPGQHILLFPLKLEHEKVPEGHPVGSSPIGVLPDVWPAYLELRLISSRFR
ncbi:MAG: hypothetical protein ABH864_00465 [archaeon]